MFLVLRFFFSFGFRFRVEFPSLKIYDGRSNKILGVFWFFDQISGKLCGFLVFKYFQVFVWVFKYFKFFWVPI